MSRSMEAATPVTEQPEDRRVLIVDDDNDLADSFADILLVRGYRVEVANSADQVAQVCARFDVQVAFLDIRLGPDSGLEVIGLLKRHRPDAICIMVTGYAEVESAIEALRLGAYDYLNKPLHPKRVLAVLDRCFDKIGLEQQARAAYEEMRAAKEAAELANRVKSEFLVAMSHELRTPLNSIIGFSEVLIGQSLGPLGDERYGDYAADIKGSGLHLLGVINDILDLAKAQAGKQELREESINLAEAVDATLRLIRPQAATARIEIEVAIAPDLTGLRGDEQKLRQILLNLLSNAVKFTPAGGRAKIAAWHDRDQGIVITVEDNGIGIAAQDIPKALAPFAQVDTCLSRDYAGTGLGLSLSVTMVELHGGTLTLESEVGAGTTVTVRFPAERSLVRTDAA